MKAILVSAAVLVFLGTMLLTAGPEPKITICHVPPGNPENVQVITIGQSAWPAHQTHSGILPNGVEIRDSLFSPGVGCTVVPETGID
jgi:hypothetical protein